MAHRSQAAIPRPSVTNSLTFRITMLVIGLFLRMVSVAERTDNIVPFKSPHRSMIVVEVRVNGKGPYPFLFDTGATSSAVDPKLFSALHLPTARSVEVASWEATTDARRAWVESLSFGPVNSGRLSVLVQPLSEFKAIDPDVRGVLGADVLLCSNFLIDNRTHHIQFDVDGTLLAQLSGDRIAMAPIRTRTGDLESRLISVPVQMDKNAEPLHMLLDTAADMVVLQPTAGPQPTVPRGTKWISDQNGKLSSATTFHTRLSVGSEVFSTEVWVGDAGLKQIVIDGLLPTGGFSQLYIANHGSFVIFEPRRIAAKPGRAEKRLLVPASSLGSTD